MSEDLSASTPSGQLEASSRGRDLGNPANAGHDQKGHTRAVFLKRAAVAGAGVTAGGAVLAACSDDDEATSATPPAPPSSGGDEVTPTIAAKFKNKTIGFAELTEADENILAIVKWAKQAAEDARLDWDIQAVDTKGDPTEAGAALTSFVTQGVDAIMMVGIGAATVESQLARAKRAGIPTIGAYTFAPPDSSISQDYTLPPEVDASLLANYIIRDQVERHPSGPINIAMLDFPSDVIQARRFAFKGLIAQEKRIEVVQEDYTISVEATAQDASSAAQALIRANPDLNAIWCNYPPIAAPAASGVAQTGQDVQVYGHIANSAGVDALRDPDSPLTATSWVDWPYQGYMFVDQALQALSGTELDRQLSVLQPDPSTVFDASNVEQEVPEGTKAADWMFAGGTYRVQFLEKWNDLYG